MRRYGPPVIFLHSSFRTASTFLWSCFRKAPRTVAYCEIFHEILNTLSLADVSALKPEGWHSKHPPGAPYFLEYVPMLREGGGVEHFDPSMTYERFIPAGGCSGDVSAMEAIYVRNLINHAECRAKVPVLTATRSLGRAAGLKRAVPGLHALIYRNLFQQWCSFTDQAFRGNPYFLDRIVDIMRLHRSDPGLGMLHQVFPVTKASAENANMFYTFTFLHLYLYTQAVGAMDLIIDVNRLETDLPYRKQIEDRVAAEGVTLDLSSTKNTIAYSVCELGSAADFSEKIGVIGNMIIDQAPDGAGREFGIKVMSDLMEEHARHDFQASALRSVMLGPTGLRAERDAVRLERDRLVEKQNELRAELDAALADARAAKLERDELASERDGLRAELDAVMVNASAIRTEREQLIEPSQTVEASAP